MKPTVHHCYASGKAKYMHTTKKSALTAAAKTKKVNGTDGTVYKCKACRCWHLTRRKTTAPS